MERQLRFESRHGNRGYDPTHPPKETFDAFCARKIREHSLSIGDDLNKEREEVSKRWMHPKLNPTLITQKK
jgi:hypothetical protein